MTTPVLTKPSIPRLSEVARKVAAPSGIVSTGWPGVEHTSRTKLGVLYDPWQHAAGQLILAKRANGRLAAMIDGVGMSVCRQVGKTFLVGGLTFALGLQRPGMLTIWSSHHARTHGETFLAMQAFAARTQVQRYVDQVYLGSGDEEIRFINGSRILFGARERGFGRGVPGVDMIVSDEGQIMSDKALDDQLATMNTSQFGLFLFMGTPPKPEDSSEAFTRMRQLAWAGSLTDGAWIELGADPDADLDDRRQWAKANPSYPKRTPAESILRLQRKLRPDSFRREGLGIWDEDVQLNKPVTLAQWDATQPQEPPELSGDRMFFITIAKDMVSASIVAASLVDGVPHVELADHRDGVGWLTERVRELHERYPRARFAAYAAGPVKAWAPTFAESHKDSAGKSRSGFELVLFTVPQSAAACAHLKKLAENLGFTHSSPRVMRDSLEGAVKRDMDGGSWVWDWKNSEGDLAPIAAVTGALWLLESTLSNVPMIF